MNYLRFIRKISLFLISIILLCNTSFADYQIKGDDIRLNTSVFSGILSSEDTTPQKAFEKIDKLNIEGFPYDCLTFIIDGHGAVISASASGSKPVPYNCTITGWEIVSSTSGSAVVDIKKTNYAGYPGSFTSIAGTEKPTLSAQQKNTDTSLTTWTTSLSAGDRIQALIDSADINGVIIVTLYLTKT